MKRLCAWWIGVVLLGGIAVAESPDLSRPRVWTAASGQQVAAVFVELSGDQKHGIAPGHVCFGGGDCGGFSNHFIYALNAAGCRVVGFNAQDAKDQRENDPASTDKLDLLGILKMRLDKGGVTRSIPLRVPRCPTPAEKSKAERIGSRQHALKSA